MARGLKVPSSHGVKISSPWPDTWPQTINIKKKKRVTRDSRSRERTAEALSLSPLFPGLHLCCLVASSSVFISAGTSVFLLPPLLPPLPSFAFHSATYLQKPRWWLKWGQIDPLGPRIPRWDGQTSKQTEDQGRLYSFFALFMRLTFTGMQNLDPNRACCSTCFISALFWAGVVTPCQ